MGTKRSCPDCGPVPVRHWTERWAAITDWAIAPFQKPLEVIWRAVEPAVSLLHLERLGPPVMRVCTAIGIGTILTEPDGTDNLRTKCLWEAAERRGITMREFRLFGRRTDICFARYRGALRIFDGLPRPAGLTAKSLDWMDDKGVMKRKFQAAGIPVARGGTAVRLAHALDIFHRIGGPAVVKPNLGSRSRHARTGIATDVELKDAFDVAKQLSPWVVVEEELRGPVFRGTVIGGRCAGIIRRDHPTVVGDGTLTVRELVAAENKNPKRRGPVFHPITLDADADTELTRQYLTTESIPKRGQRVRLNEKVDRGYGGTTTDVTDEMHPENVAVLERVGRYLEDPLVGIDFIIEDITKPWSAQQACGVIECNSLPFLDLHAYPFAGPVRDAAGALWELVFPENNRE